jgi:hypothetical protein
MKTYGATFTTTTGQSNSPTTPKSVKLNQWIYDLAVEVGVPYALGVEFYAAFGPKIFNRNSRTYRSHICLMAKEWNKVVSYYCDKFGTLNPSQHKAILNAATEALSLVRHSDQLYAYSLTAIRGLRKDDNLHFALKLLKNKPVYNFDKLYPEL